MTPIKRISVCLFVISINYCASQASLIEAPKQSHRASSKVADQEHSEKPVGLANELGPIEADYMDPDQASKQPIGSAADNLSNQLEQDELQLHLSSLQQRRPNFANRLPDKDYLSHDLAEEACRFDRGCQRKDKLNNTYLIHCSRHKLENLLSNEILMSLMHDSSEECERILLEFIQLDEQIDHFNKLFETLLQRYNCHNGYSVKWNCKDCERAYKDWLCTTNLPYYMNGERIKPCISFCERVEQRCPYLHPIVREQYGGQPAFICRDPNIPNVPKLTPDIYYSEPSKCYDLCHLSDDLAELVIDSLSKYDYTKCPPKSSIAEEVRGDPLYCESASDAHPTASGDAELASNRGPNATRINPTDSGPSAVLDQQTPIHVKKLRELREVVRNYENQPRVHKFSHQLHSSVIQPTEAQQPIGYNM